MSNIPSAGIATGIYALGIMAYDIYLFEIRTVCSPEIIWFFVIQTFFFQFVSVMGFAYIYGMIEEKMKKKTVLPEQFGPALIFIIGCAVGGIAIARNEIYCGAHGRGARCEPVRKDCVTQASNVTFKPDSRENTRAI